MIELAFDLAHNYATKMLHNRLPRDKEPSDVLIMGMLIPFRRLEASPIVLLSQSGFGFLHSSQGCIRAGGQRKFPKGLELNMLC